MSTTIHNNNKQQFLLFISVLENAECESLSWENISSLEWLLADFVCGTETNCCLTDERKYSRTDSSPFASLHNYIITYLGWSLAWWFWLLAVILLVLSSVFPSDWRLKDFLSCLLISDAIENFPDERLCDLIMTLNIICLLLVFTSVLSDSLRNCSRKWENKSTQELFTDRQKRYCTGLHFNGFPSVPFPCRVLIRDDWILKNYIDETISTSITSGLIVFP